MCNSGTYILEVTKNCLMGHKAQLIGGTHFWYFKLNQLSMASMAMCLGQELITATFPNQYNS